MTPEHLFAAANKAERYQSSGYDGYPSETLDCIHFTQAMNQPGLIDEAFAELVASITSHQVILDKLYGESYGLSIFDLDGRMILSRALVTHRHQVCKILAAYGMEVPE